MVVVDTLLWMLTFSDVILMVFRPYLQISSKIRIFFAEPFCYVFLDGILSICMFGVFFHVYLA